MNFLFCLISHRILDVFHYNRVRLSKRRKIGGVGAGAPTSNSRLIVKHREADDQELAAQVSRGGREEGRGILILLTLCHTRA